MTASTDLNRLALVPNPKRSAASRNDMVGLQKLQDSLVEQIGDIATTGTKRRTVSARLADLHAQGFILEDAAAALGITADCARVTASHLNLKFKTDTQRRREKRQDVIRKGYAENRPLEDIAAEIGTTVTGVMVQASRLGVTRSCAEAADYRRGFSVPDHLKEDYRLLRQRGKYRAREAGIALGLLEV